MPDFGYAGEILKVDLSDGKISRVPSSEYTDKYIGGHGIAARLYWEMVPPDAKAYDPENCLICANGPVTGFPGFAGFRWKICGKSPLGTEDTFTYCNLGERWGSTLKYAGYDALVVQGKAEKPVYLYIDNDKVEIRDASHLWGLSTYDTNDALKAELGKKVSVLAIGPAAENLIPYASLFAEGSSGSGGLGTVMGSKNLKAVVAAGNKHPVAAAPDRVRQLVAEIKASRPPGDMPSMWAVPGITRPHTCFGCGIGCSREEYDGEKSRKYKVLCQASMFYGEHVLRYTGKDNGEKLIAPRLCDEYGIDTSIMHGMIQWLQACYDEGLLDDKGTGLPLSKIGSAEFMESLIKKITYRQDFGEALAKGTITAAEKVGPRAQEMISFYIANPGNETKDYDPRLLITTGIINAVEPRRSISQLHEVCSPLMAWLGMGNGKPGEHYTSEMVRNDAARFWGSEIAGDFSTYGGKALAAKIIQDRVFARESLVTCDLRWTMSQFGPRPEGAPEPVVPSQVYSAITGKETDEAGLSKLGERIFNLQRAIILRQGRPGREGDKLMDYYHKVGLRKGELFYNEDCLAPGKDGEIISKLGWVVERDKFEQMKSEYYELRDWDVESGLPTRRKLEELQLNDVADDLEGRGLLK